MTEKEEVFYSGELDRIQKTAYTVFYCMINRCRSREELMKEEEGYWSQNDSCSLKVLSKENLIFLVLKTKLILLIQALVVSRFFVDHMYFEIKCTLIIYITSTI